jgi:hypothetical protein
MAPKGRELRMSVLLTYPWLFRYARSRLRVMRNLSANAGREPRIEFIKAVRALFSLLPSIGFKFLYTRLDLVEGLWQTRGICKNDGPSCLPDIPG